MGWRGRGGDGGSCMYNVELYVRLRMGTILCITIPPSR